MAITTLGQLQAALEAPQLIPFLKTSVNSPSTTAWNSQFDKVGNPGGGTLAGTSTAAGVVPDDSTTGCPAINNFAAGKTGYLGSVEFSFGPSTNYGPVRFRLCDMLFKAGAYSFNSNVTLAAQPSYSARIPGADYKGTEIWIENVATLTGALTVTITYTNQDGTAGRSTSVSVGTQTSASILTQVPLASGDSGVQKIESVVGSVATAGTFNVLVLRPLWMGTGHFGTEPNAQGPDLTDLPSIFDTSALFVMMRYVSGFPTTLNVAMNVING